MDPDDTTIRFGCRRCLARLKASQAQAGTKRRCPRCQLVLVVPLESKLPVLGEGYPLCELAEPWSAARQAYIPVLCTVCRTRLHATADQVGQELVCPDCGTSVPVTALREFAKKAEPAAALEQYPLCEEVEATPGIARAADLTYIPVVCTTCGTRLLATEDQVGQEITCPDCRVPTLVRRPAGDLTTKKGAQSRAAQQVGEYALSEDMPEAQQGSAARQTFVAVVCHTCGTRLYATEDQVGHEITCPDCGAATPVRAPRRPARKPDPMAGAGEGIGIAEPGEVFQERPFLYRPSWRQKYEESYAAEQRRMFGRPPRWPLVSGVWTFPFQAGAMTRWLVLSASAMALMGLLVPAVTIAQSRATGAAAAADAVIGMILMATAMVLGLGWLPLVAGNLLAILGDTASGCHRMETMPEVRIWGALRELLFLFNAFFLSSLPAAGLIGVFEALGWQHWFCLPISLWLLFPVVLLSMLDANSPAVPLSAWVWRSMRRHWRVWLLFYVESLLMAVGYGAMLGAVGPLPDFWPIFPVCVLTMFFAIIYFRLLGRLAWCCGEPAREDDEPPGEPEAADRQSASGYSSSPQSLSNTPGFDPWA